MVNNRFKKGLLAFDRREERDDSKDGQISTGIKTLALVQFALDKYGRVLELDTSKFDDNIADHIYDELGYNEISSNERRPLPNWIIFQKFRAQTPDESGFVIIPESDPDDYDLTKIHLPPENLNGEKLLNWREDHRARGESEAQVLAKIVQSAQWLARRLLRTEPVLEIAGDGNEIQVLGELDELLHAGGSDSSNNEPVSYRSGDAKPAEVARVEFVPDTIDGRPPPGRRLWPRIELDLLLQADGFPAQTREHFGRWTMSEDSQQSSASNKFGLVTLDPCGFLHMHGFQSRNIIWPTNLMARRPLAERTCCVWRPGWRWWYGYRITNSESYRLQDVE